MMSSLTFFFSSSPRISLFLHRDLRAFASPTPRVHHHHHQRQRQQQPPKRTIFADPSLPSFHRRGVAPSCSASEQQYSPDATPNPQDESDRSKGFWSKWMMDTAELRSKVAKLGLAAVLAYGLFDGVTYTTFFVLAFLGYEKSTGSNPAANLKALLGIVILMWTGNNITRPFRVAGAAALAPAIDQGLKRIQKYFKFQSQIYAFALVVSIVATACLSVVGLLIRGK